MLSFIEFRTLVEQDPSSSRGGQRDGQWAFNCLFLNRPDLSEQIRGLHSILDPYYIDACLPLFWAWVEAHWGDEIVDKRTPDEVRSELIQKAIDASRGEDVF